MKTSPKLTDKSDYDSMIESLAGEQPASSKRSSVLTRLLGQILCPGLPPWQQRMVARIMLGAIGAGVLTGALVILAIRLEFW